MKYLAIGKSYRFLALSLFEDLNNEVTLKEVRFIRFDDFNQSNIFKKAYETVVNYLSENVVSVVVTHKLNTKKILKKEIQRISEMRAIIQLACAEKKVFVVEPKTDGWEAYITKGRNTFAKKRDIVENGYDIDLSSICKNEDEYKVLVDTIVLGEALANKRLML
ncbi:MAG: hypothetical protein EOM19_07030 [Candidatus Moranbacteria bacterium]|nr:hypothetical protein [Candidatus Moranbacteria bacterium]